MTGRVTGALLLVVSFGVFFSMSGLAQVLPQLLPPGGDRGGEGDPVYDELTDFAAAEDFTDDAGSNPNHFLSQIPASSIVVRWGCTGNWENTTLGDLAVGDKLMVAMKVMNISTSKSIISFGAAGFGQGGAYWATVESIQTGTLPAEAPYWKVCSQDGMGRVYCSSLVDGFYAVFHSLPTQCNPITIPNKFKFKSPGNLTSSDFIWWLVDQWECQHVCCSLGQACDCFGLAWGCPDSLNSVVTMTSPGPLPWVSLKIALPPNGQGWKNSIKAQIGGGLWKIKIAIPIQGDAWTDRTNPLIDEVGHLVGMDKYAMMVSP